MAIEQPLRNITTINHYFINLFVKEGMVCIDATLGKGHDAQKLLSNVGTTGYLYGFDIQEIAIATTDIKLKTTNQANYTLILQSHDLMHLFVKESVDFIIFNLGYLPTGEKSITTQVASTLKALVVAYNLIRVNGKILITVYPGHEEGFREAQALKVFLESVPQQKVDVLRYEFINHINNPPYSYVIEKKCDCDLSSYIK